MGRSDGNANATSAIYGLGVIGGWFWFWQQADGFWEHVGSIFQGLFWPAYMVYQVFETLD